MASVNKIILRETAPRDLVAILEIKFILTYWFIHSFIIKKIVTDALVSYETYDASAGNYFQLL
ncbi:MAG: hypothetical protein ACJATW_001132 [Glaciecola sp.]|jgi:hypothetical protein